MTGRKKSGESVTERATVRSLETLRGKRTIMTFQKSKPHSVGENCMKIRNGEEKLRDSISLFFLWEDKLIIRLKNDSCLETNYHNQIRINKGNKSSASASNTYIPLPTCIQSRWVPIKGLKASREGIWRKFEWNREGTKD